MTYRIPALFIYTLDTHTGVSYHQSVYTEGNVIDVVVCQDTTRILYSVDNFHKPRTTNVRLTDEFGPFVGALSYQVEDRTWVDESSADWVKAINRWSARETDATSDKTADVLSDLLYSTEHLRKMATDDQE